MRLVMSAPTEHPLVWSVTKIENTKPVGLQKLTIYQNFWNEHTDYIEKDVDGNIIGMYANYFDSEILPDDTEHLVDDLPFKSVKIVSSTRSIKVGGSYKTFSVAFYYNNSEDITSTYNDYKYTWSCIIDEDYGKPSGVKKEYLIDENKFYILDEEGNNIYSENNINEIDYTQSVNWLSVSDYNKIKMKLPNDKSLLGKVMKIQCVISKENEKSIVAFDYFEITG